MNMTIQYWYFQVGFLLLASLPFLANGNDYYNELELDWANSVTDRMQECWQSLPANGWNGCAPPGTSQTACYDCIYDYHNPLGAGLDEGLFEGFACKVLQGSPDRSCKESCDAVVQGCEFKAYEVLNCLKRAWGGSSSENMACVPPEPSNSNTADNSMEEEEGGDTVNTSSSSTGATSESFSNIQISSSRSLQATSAWAYAFSILTVSCFLFL